MAIARQLLISNMAEIFGLPLSEGEAKICVLKKLVAAAAPPLYSIATLSRSTLDLGSTTSVHVQVGHFMDTLWTLR